MSFLQFVVVSAIKTSVMSHGCLSMAQFCLPYRVLGMSVNDFASSLLRHLAVERNQRQSKCTLVPNQKNQFRGFAAEFQKHARTTAYVIHRLPILCASPSICCNRTRPGFGDFNDSGLIIWLLAFIALRLPKNPMKTSVATSAPFAHGSTY